MLIYFTLYIPFIFIYFLATESNLRNQLKIYELFNHVTQLKWQKNLTEETKNSAYFLERNLKNYNVSINSNKISFVLRNFLNTRLVLSYTYFIFVYKNTFINGK